MSRRFFVALFIFILLVAGTVFVLLRASSPISLTHPVVFEIKQGDSVWEISQTLSERGIIRSPLWFVVQTFFAGRFGSFKPGVYEISSMSLSDLVHLLSLGPQEVRATIIPGMTIREIDTLFSERGIVPAGSLATATPQAFRDVCSVCTYASGFEGLFAPETYQFYRGSDPRLVIRTILEISEKNIHSALGGMTSTDRNLYEKIIIASLLEKEVRSYSDKQLVSGIIYKRLSLHMPLQIDASVLYGACIHKTGECSITRDTFRTDGPFNTYTRKELPPTPIASPSLDSLRAAFHPQPSSYLYYLTDPTTGITHFSKTFDEHDSKRGAYIMQQ